MNIGTQNILNAIEALAVNLHRGQVRKYNGEPYSNHLKRVAGEVRSRVNHLYENDIIVIVGSAFLHDSIEDERISEENLWDELIKIGLPPFIIHRILEVVKILSKKPGQSLIEYLSKIDSSGDARIVKIFDIQDNASDLKERDLKKWDSYQLQLYFLNN